MREAGAHKAEFARRLGIDPREIDRLLDFGHATRLNRIDDALTVRPA